MATNKIREEEVKNIYCTTKKCQNWHFLVVMAWRQGRKQTVSPIDIQWRSIKKIMGASLLKKVGARFFFKKSYLCGKYLKDLNPRCTHEKIVNVHPNA